MAILHTLRSARFALKGLLLRNKIVPDPNNPPRVLTNSMYVGLRMTDLFGHMNNAVYLQAFEFSRWQVFQASGFNAKAFQAKIFPVVASVHVNYFRQILPFQIIYVQTGCLGTVANGRQMLMVQHMFDSKKRLCATAIFHVPLLSWKTNKPIPIREAFKKMGLDYQDLFMLQQGQELNDPRAPVDISLESIEKYKKAASHFGGLHLTDFFPKTDAHIPMSPASLEANVIAGAYLTAANDVQRKWFKGQNNNSNSSDDGKQKDEILNHEQKPEGKSAKKK